MTRVEPRNRRPPAGIGNIAAQAVIDARRHDGSNQYGDLTPAPCPVFVPWPQPCAASAYGQTSANPGRTGAYSDYVADGYTPYVPINPLMGYCNPLVALCERQEIVDPNHWQPLIFTQRPGVPGLREWDRRDVSGNSGLRRPALGTRHTVRADVVEPVRRRADDPAPGLPEELRPVSERRQRHDPVQPEPGHPAQADRRVLGGRAVVRAAPGHWGCSRSSSRSATTTRSIRTPRCSSRCTTRSFDAGIVAWHQAEVQRGAADHGGALREARADDQRVGRPGTAHRASSPARSGRHTTRDQPDASVSRATSPVIRCSRVRAPPCCRLFTGNDFFGFSTVLPANFGRVEPGIPRADHVLLRDVQ